MWFIWFVAVVWVVAANPVLNGRDVGSISKQKNSVINIFNPGKYPYIVLLDMKTEIYKNNDLWLRTVKMCGGSLIQRSVVLTAAHCFENFLIEPTVSIFAGIVHRKLERGGQFTLMKDYIMHSEYVADIGKNFQQNDIALVWVRTPFTLTEKVQLIAIPNANKNLEKKKVSIAGWGLTEDGHKSDILKEGELKIVSQKKCQRAHKSTRITNSMLCGISEEKNTLPCVGDSGGPLVYKNIVYGVSSWVEGRDYIGSDGEKVYGCNSKYPAVFTKVSDYKTWIVQNIQLGPPKEHKREEITTELR